MIRKNIRQRLDSAIRPYIGKILTSARMESVRVAIRAALHDHARDNGRAFYSLPEHTVEELSDSMPGHLVIRWGTMADWWRTQLAESGIYPDFPKESYDDWRKRVAGNPDLEICVSLRSDGVWWTVSISAKSEDPNRPNTIWVKATSVEEALRALHKHPKAAALAHFRKERVLLVGASRKDAEKFAPKYPDAKIMAAGDSATLVGCAFDRIVYTPGADKIRRNLENITTRRAGPDASVEVAK